MSEKPNAKELQKQKDIADSRLPNQGEGFLLSNAGNTVEHEKARQELDQEKQLLAGANPRNKNSWVGPGPQQRGIPTTAIGEPTGKPEEQVKSEDIEKEQQKAAKREERESRKEEKEAQKEERKDSKEANKGKNSNK